MDFNRVLDLKNLLSQKSYFLFGPRATGKTTLIRKQLKNSTFLIDLLHSDTRLKLLQQPALLRELVNAQNKKWIVIDEIQKIPDLLDEVHSLIEEKKYHFLLTGSSARKLKRGAANLLAGRARTAQFFPLVSAEIPQFDLKQFLRLGGLPFVYHSSDPWGDLKAYIETYLNEEIQSEGLIRNLGHFSRFLTVAASMHGNLVNFASLASDTMVSESTVKGYFEVLKDTLLGSLLETFKESKKRKAIQTAKFYFFDIGVVHALLDIREVPEKTELFGRALESWVLQELRAYHSYRRTYLPLTFWRSVNGQEVDFCIGNEIAIEVKSKSNLLNKDLKSLIALKEENIFKKYYIVSLDPMERVAQNIRCLYWKTFIEKLWTDQL